MGVVGTEGGFGTGTRMAVPEVRAVPGYGVQQRK